MANLVSLTRLITEDPRYAWRSELRSNRQFLVVTFNGVVVIEAGITGHLFLVRLSEVIHALQSTSTQSTHLPAIWHYRLGHPCDRIYSETRKCYQDTLPTTMKQFCDGCAFSKLVSTKIPSSSNNLKHDANFPIGRLHLDTVGPLPVSIDHFIGFVSVLCEYSSYR